MLNNLPLTSRTGHLWNQTDCHFQFTGGTACLCDCQLSKDGSGQLMTFYLQFTNGLTFITKSKNKNVWLWDTEGCFQMNHGRSERCLHIPRLQEVERLCPACRTLYIGSHKSFALTTFTSSFNSKSFCFLSHPYGFINSHTSLIKRFHLIENIHHEADS